MTDSAPNNKSTNHWPLGLDSRSILIALVVLAGGGNAVFTKVSGDKNFEGTQDTTRQISEMHATLAQFKSRIDEIDSRWDAMDIRSQEILETVRRLDDFTDKIGTETNKAHP
jgi:hypothetical protein